MEWISVKDRLPEETENVLWCKVPVVEPYYCGCLCDRDFTHGYYTHWMFLPQSPEGINDKSKWDDYKQFDLPAACVFNLQQIALADDDVIKQPGAAEKYRFIARHILQLFKIEPPKQ